jgi:tetratricopeptide (TPR) repeat protein
MPVTGRKAGGDCRGGVQRDFASGRRTALPGCLATALTPNPSPLFPASREGEGRVRAGGLCAVVAANLFAWRPKEPLSSHALSLCLVFCLLSLLFYPARAQNLPTLVIVSLPTGKVPIGEFVDLAPYIDRDLAATGRFHVVVYKPGLPAIRAAMDAKTLTARDLVPPMSVQSARKIARALNADVLLRVSGRYTKEGISASAEAESYAGQDRWDTVFVQTLTPYRNKKSGPLEGILAHSKAIAERFGGAPSKTTKPTQTPVGDRNGTNRTADRSADTRPPGVNPGNMQPPVIPNVPTGSAPSPYEIMAERARRNNDVPNLIVALRRAITEKPRDVRLRCDLAEAYKAGGWSQAAREEALRAVAIAPDDPALHRLVGDAYADSGEMEEALKEYREAVRLDGKSAANLVALGDACWNTAKPDEAQQRYADAAQAEPKNPLPYRRLARLYAQRSRFADCAAAIKAALERTPDDDREAFNADFASLLTFVETGLNDAIAKMQIARKAFNEGTRNREQTFKDLSDTKQRAEELASFLDSLPDTTFSRIQALYAQGAALVVQSFESALQALETVNTGKEEEANLLRIEAVKQIADASRRLKALTAPKK